MDKKELFDISPKPIFSTLIPFAQNFQGNEFFKPVPKAILGSGFRATAHAGYLKLISRILDFSNVK